MKVIVTGKTKTLIQNVFERNRFIKSYKSSKVLQSKLNIQLLTACAFFILSFANIISQSYFMLIFTASGCVTNIIFAFVAKMRNKGDICAYSSIATCSLLFGFFVIYGGNDGFACLWVVLLPPLAMAAMDLIIGLCASVFFQLFLVIVFWTPARNLLMYRYNSQFCLRFPLLFFVTFSLGLMLTLSLQKSKYNDCKHLQKLEELTEQARVAARIDPLTKLANRRSAYEEFMLKYTAEGRPHCIVMGDIDNFKRINDTFGHEFGDEVLVLFAKYINELLPPDYLKSRWGGEEFLFAANAPLAEVYDEVEQLRKAIAEHEFNSNGTPTHITITFGIAEYNDPNGLAKAISEADNRLYTGKKIKKNCTVTSS